MKEYLGDGVYIEDQEDYFELTTFDGVVVTNIIVLDQDVIAFLIDYLKKKGCIG